MPELLDAVYGCLVGGAIGDAMGAPVEGAYWEDLVRDHGKIRTLLPNPRNNTGTSYGEINTRRRMFADEPHPAGMVTDDTTMRTYLCDTIVRVGGRVTPDEFAATLLAKLNKDRVWLNEWLLLDKLRTGMNPWDTGRGNPPAGCASMLIAPVGIINAGDPRQAYQDGYVIAGINQEGANREGAATLAAGVAEAFRPGADADSVVAAMRAHASYVYERALDMALDMARAEGTVEGFCARFYERMLDWTWPSPDPWDARRFFSGSSTEIVPLVAAVLTLTGGDPEAAIVEGVAVGRDNDTISSICGSIAGALHGAGRIPRDWIDVVETANRPFFEEVFGDADHDFAAMAADLVGALASERDRVAERAALLARVVGPAD